MVFGVYLPYMTQEQESKVTPAVSSVKPAEGTSEVVSAAFGRRTGYKVVAGFISLLLIGLVVLFMLSMAKTADKENVVQRDEAVKTAVAAISAQDGPNIEKVGDAVKKIDALPADNTDRSAEYIATWYYVQVSDAKNARKHLDRLAAAEKKGQPLDVELQDMASSTNLKNLTDSVKFLEEHKSSGGVTGG
jgi:hypothetical protein